MVQCMEKESYLKKLIGKTVTGSEIGTSTTYAIGKSQEDPDFERAEIEISIFFDNYFLNIQNPITITPSDKEPLDFVGLKVIATSETREEGELVFDNGYKIIIDLREEAYNGPEAMNLTGPNNFFVVWR